MQFTVPFGTGANAGKISFFSDEGSPVNNTYQLKIDIIGFITNTIVENDAASVNEDDPATAVNVLANDTDPDDTLEIASVTQPVNGTVVLTPVGPGPYAGLTYQPNPDYCNTPPGTALDTFTYTLTLGLSANVRMTVNCKNDAPVVTTTAGATAFTEGGGPVVVDSGLTVNDVDNVNLTSATVTITNPQDVGSEVLNATNCGSLILAPGPNTLSITGSQSLATYQTCLRSVTYDNTSLNPDLTTRVISFVANDGTTSSAAATKDVAMSSVANAPVVTTTAGTTAFTEDGGAVVVDSGVTVTDPDSANLASATMMITNLQDGASEVLSATACAGLTVTPGTTLTITGSQPKATYQTCLQSVTYNNTSQNPNTTARVISFAVNDGAVNSAAANKTVTVAAMDDAPVAVADSATVAEDSGATSIDVLANDTDVDAGPKTIASATDPANGTVVLTPVGPGPYTGLTYTPDANYCNSVSGTPDTFSYTLTPGSSSTTVSVTVTCSDDPPTAVADSAIVAEDSGATAIDVLANDLDVDGGTKNVASATDPANGTVVLTPVGPGPYTGLTYAPDANYCNSISGTPDTFSYSLTPGSSSTTVSVTVTCVNDAPAIDLDANDDKGTGGANFAITFTEGDAAKLIEDPADAVITDVDNPTLTTLTVTLTNLLDPTFEVLDANVSGFPNITKAYDTTTPGIGILTLSTVTPQPIADFVAVLRTVTYRNTDTAPATTARVINFVANDGTNPSNTATATVTVAAVDSPPVAVADSATVAEDSGATAIDVLANDTDADGGAKNIASATDPANGTVVLTPPGGPYTGLTYTPDANYCNSVSGTPDTFSYTLTPGSSSTTVSVTVTCSDDAPTAVADSATVAEDSGATAIDVLANDTDNDGGAKNIASATDPANGTVVLTPVGPGPYTGLTYTPDANYCNSVSGTPDTFSYTLTPGSSSTTVSVTVTCVDDTPVAVADSTTVVEDSGATSIDVLANDTDVDGGTKNIASATDPANGTVVLTPVGPGPYTGLTYTPDPNYCNSTSGTPDTFNYTLSPGSSFTTVSVTVTCVNDPPAANADTADITEEAPNVPALNTVSGNVLTNDVDVDSTLTVSAVAGGSVGSPRAGLYGSVTINSNGSYTYTLDDSNPTVNALAPGGTLIEPFGYTASDGSFTSSSTLTVTIHGADDPATPDNDAADFIGNTQLEVDRDTASTPEVIASTPANPPALGVLDGDVDPDGGPAITIAGIVGCADLTAPFDCTVPGEGTVSLQEDGSFSFVPVAGDTDPTASFQYTLVGNPTVPGTVTLTRVSRVWYVKNDQPDGGLGRSTDPFDTLAEAEAASAPNDTIYVYSGDGVATKQNNGISLKNGQRLIGEGVVLDVPVSVNGGPNPTFLRAAGTHPLIHNSSDDAGEDNGVVVNATAASLTGIEIRGLGITGRDSGIDITATGANNAGVAIANNVVTSDSVTGLEGIDVNANGTGTVTVAVTNNGLSGRGNAFDARTGAAGAQLRIDLSNNTNILSNASGVVIDGSGGGNVTITGFANNTVSGNTVGVGINVATAVFDATPGGTFQLVSGGTTVVGAAGPGGGAGAGMIMTNVSGDLSFTDLDIFTDNGAGLSASGAVAYTGSAGLQLSVGPTSSISAVGGPAVSLSTVSGSLPFTSVSSTNSPNTGISLVNFADGSGNAVFSATSGSLTNNVGATGPAFNVSGGNAKITYPGAITNNGTGRAVSISNWSGDDASPGDDLLLSGAIDENGAGILVNSNGGSRSITFSGGMDIDTTTGEGFAATTNTNTGGLHITGTNTIDSVSAAALRVTNTTIGNSNLNFQHISSGNNTAAPDPANGIVLSNTGTSGGLIVTGNGGGCTEGSSSCTGGWIQNITGGDDSSATPVGTGIVLNNTANVSLTRMRINDTSNYGIRGTSVSGFTFTNGIVDGANGTNVSTPFNEGSMLFFGVTGTSSGLTGTSSITNSTIMGGRQRNIAIDNSVGSLNLTVSGNIIKRTSDAAGDDGFFLEADTTANVTLAVTNNTFARHGGDHINISLVNNAVVDATITGNILHGNYPGTPEGNHPIGLGQGIFILGASFNGTFTYEISNNGTDLDPFRGNRQGGAINVNKGSGTGTFSGSIENNVIGDPAVTGSGSSEAFGIIVGARGSGGAHTTLINNNKIRQYFDRGIVLEAGEGSAGLNATVTNNTVSNFADATNSLHGIHSDNGILAGDTNAVCLQISGNSVATAGNEPQGGADIRLRRGSSTTVRLPGVAGSTNADATTLLQANNPTATTITVTGNGFSSGAACPLP